jgi:hypothetical protein
MLLIAIIHSSIPLDRFKIIDRRHPCLLFVSSSISAGNIARFRFLRNFIA